MLHHRYLLLKVKQRACNLHPIIRGVGTLNGSADPLFIVDGIQYEGALTTINQEDIESITILKDASSTSLYGSRAANGVVLITTKKGVKGETKVSASVQYGLVSSGGDNHRVFFSTSYLDEGGYVKTSEFDRLTTRLNGDFDVKDWLTIGGNANITTSN